MTLINYLTRVHFADGVLEEALWAELSRNRKSRPLIILDPASSRGEAAERMLDGIPSQTDAMFFRDRPAAPTEVDARRFADLYERENRDVVIACGGRAVVEFARVARLAVGTSGPLVDALQRARRRPPPDLYLAPRLSGFAAALGSFGAFRTEAGERRLFTSRDLIPTVAIFDPTLDLDADPGESASAGAEALVACVEPYLSAGFNPPADGIALDGLRRALDSLPRILDGGRLADRREMAAAGLNGGLAQEKGLGAAHALAHALSDLSDAAPDAGAVARLVLPGVLRIGGGQGRDARRLTVRDMLALTSKDCLAEGVEAFLRPLPLPGRLSQMGVGRDELSAAAEAAARDLQRMRAPKAVGAAALHAVLEAAY